MFAENIEGNFPENEEQEFNEENQEFAIQQEIQIHDGEVENNDNENLAENDQIVIEYSEQDHEIIIQSGNSQTVYKGQLVEDKEGRQYIISDGQMIPLQDILSEDALKEGTIQEVYVKEDEEGGEMPVPEAESQEV